MSRMRAGPVLRVCAALVLLPMAACFDWAIASRGDAGADAGADARDEGASCEALRQAVVTARAEATSCGAVVMSCTQAVPGGDECGCDVFCDDASAAAVAEYRKRVAALKAAGCALPCAACPPSVAAPMCVDGHCVAK